MDTVDNHLIIVPCDFSPLSYQAMEHGAYMSKSMNCRLLILHVATQETDIPAMEKKLCFVAEECSDRFGVHPEVMIRSGNSPYPVIKKVTKELNPMLVILKTGGGIRTIKILSGTHTPFLVIQDAPNQDTLKNIVFPINFLNPHDTKLKRVVFFSQYYPDAVMHIITPSGKGTDKERNITSNLNLMTNVLKKQKVEVNFITHDKKKNTAENILELSKGVNADMIMIQMEDVSAISKFFFGLREEKLITNQDKIPVLCMHRLSDFKGLSM